MVCAVIACGGQPAIRMNEFDGARVQGHNKPNTLCIGRLLDVAVVGDIAFLIATTRLFCS